jgi:hypothetical protein
VRDGKEKKLIIRLFSMLLLLVLVAVCSCAGSIEPEPDPEFDGLWVVGRMDITIHHEHPGLLYGLGFNNNAGAEWDSLAFTGEVYYVDDTEGRATIEVCLYKGQYQLASTRETLLRKGKDITLELEYFANGTGHSESYRLRKYEPGSTP